MTSTTRNFHADAIAFALDIEDGVDFLTFWRQGQYDDIRLIWPHTPEFLLTPTHQPVPSGDDGSLFPVARLDEVANDPSNFRLLERVPLTRVDQRFPVRCAELQGDEEVAVIIDVETTGLNAETDRIIELGMTKIRYDTATGVLTEVVASESLLEDPGIPITAEITRLTGIDQSMVAGHRIVDEHVTRFVEGAGLIIAHNAGFDRPFVDRRFPALKNALWACSLNGVDWAGLGQSSRKLEALLAAYGYFYDAHRASTDCLALAWLMLIKQEAFRQLQESARAKTFIVRAMGASFDCKDALKGRGYRWHGGDESHSKHWWREISEDELTSEQAFLDETYANGATLAQYEQRDARTRFL